MAGVLESVDMRTNLAGENRMELLIFQLGTEQPFGINVFKVKEVYTNPKITELPDSHPSILGATNFRGDTIPIIDISKAMGMGPLSDLELKTVITSEYNMSLQGLLVRQVEKIINISWDEIHSPPIFTGTNFGSYVVGVTNVDGRLVEIVDVEKILDEISPRGEMISQSILEQEEMQAVREESYEVFLAEDSAVIRKKLERTLNQMNINLTSAENGKLAIEALTKMADAGEDVPKKYLALISDIEMPEIDGYTLVKLVRDDPRLASMPVVLHSSMSGGFNESLVKSVGADHFISKYQPDLFAEMIVELVKKYRAKHGQS